MERAIPYRCTGYGLQTCVSQFNGQVEQHETKIKTTAIPIQPINLFKPINLSPLNPVSLTRSRYSFNPHSVPQPQGS